MAQAVGSDDGQIVEKVEISILNPSADPQVNQRVTDLVRRNINIFPGKPFNRSEANLGVSRAARQAAIADAQLDVLPGQTGGLVVTVKASLGEKVLREDRGYLLTGERSDLPVLFDREGTVIVGKLETLSMIYGNANAWYGRPDLFLAGNPLASGEMADEGASAWAEGFIHSGIYGLTPLGENIYAYGGLSGILSGSAGTELFTDESRYHIGVEDAYLGLVGGQTSEAGDRLLWNVSAGRKRYAIGDSMIIGNTASNGDERAALQSNPRWAADMLVLGQLRYNNTLAEAFYLDPDELPVVDSQTRMAGINLETDLGLGFNLAGSFIKVLESDYSYFALTPPDPVSATLGRDGLQVYDARLNWKQPDGQFFADAEFAVQRNDNFDMYATAIAGEVGYQFQEIPWTPLISYRYAQFSGDDPATSRFERWDPLLSGGNGEQWVQGINHFKLFQDSNLVTHRIQLRLRPSPKVELVPQFWIFTADSGTNLGGNPALSFLGSEQLGYEANLTGKWFISQQMMVQAHVAATFPGEAAKQAASGDLDPWWSAMAFLRIAF
ncbi:hypothetical protein IP76_03040 [Rhizobium sp. AAP43]|nr:hypothetical protein IP76_03040 [Rhizobium sp. AAP43]